MGKQAFSLRALFPKKLPHLMQLQWCDIMWIFGHSYQLDSLCYENSQTRDNQHSLVLPSSFPSPASFQGIPPIPSHLVLLPCYFHGIVLLLVVSWQYSDDAV